MASQMSNTPIVCNILLLRQTSLTCFQKSCPTNAAGTAHLCCKATAFIWFCLLLFAYCECCQLTRSRYGGTRDRVTKGAAFTSYSFLSGWLQRPSPEAASWLESRQATGCQHKWNKNYFPRQSIFSSLSTVKGQYRWFTLPEMPGYRCSAVV